MKANKSYRYRVVDVFTSQPLEGNPLAVFPEETDLTSEQMQKITRELNLSETVFVLPSTRSGCAARLRIFTPRKELDFAGHPTIGTAFVLRDEGLVAKETENFAVEEGVGPVAITYEPAQSRLWLMTPPIKELGTVERKTAAGLLGLPASALLDVPPQILTAGNPTLFVAVADRQTVDRISFDTSAWSRFRKENSLAGCLFVFAAVPEGAYSRMFAPDYGVPEDPATGSSTGPLAAYMMKHALTPSAAGTSFYSEQGTAMGRRSILHVRIHGEGGTDGIAVGGDVAPVIEGKLSF